MPDIVDLIFMAVVVVGFSLPFVGIRILFEVRKRKWQASHKALEELQQKRADRLR
jgi:hypothetical protein